MQTNLIYIHVKQSTQFCTFNTRTNNGFYNLYLPMHIKLYINELTRFRGFMVQDLNK